ALPESDRTACAAIVARRRGLPVAHRGLSVLRRCGERLRARQQGLRPFSVLARDQLLDGVPAPVFRPLRRRPASSRKGVTPVVRLCGGPFHTGGCPAETAEVPGLYSLFRKSDRTRSRRCRRALGAEPCLERPRPPSHSVKDFGGRAGRKRPGRSYPSAAFA